MKKAFALLLASTLCGCSGGSSSGGTLVPGQIDPNGPSARPPSRDPGPPPDMTGAPPSTTLLPGCPALRADELPIEELTESDFRTLVVGTYRTCNSLRQGLEIRLDPDTDELFWYQLDERFVRTGDSGKIVVESCAGSSCTVGWDISGGAGEPKDVTVYRDPIALVVYDASAFENGSPEWVRVAR